jgi:hypothetical protein
MRIELSPGEKLFVTYQGTDGCVMVSFDQDATRVRSSEHYIHPDKMEEIMESLEPIAIEWFAGYGSDEDNFGVENGS